MIARVSAPPATAGSAAAAQDAARWCRRHFRPRHQLELSAGFLQPQSAGWIGLQHRARPRQSPLTDFQRLAAVGPPHRSSGHEQQPDQLGGILLGAVVPDQIVALRVFSRVWRTRRTGRMGRTGRRRGGRCRQISDHVGGELGEAGGASSASRASAASARSSAATTAGTTRACGGNGRLRHAAQHQVAERSSRSSPTLDQRDQVHLGDVRLERPGTRGKVQPKSGGAGAAQYQRGSASRSTNDPHGRESAFDGAPRNAAELERRLLLQACASPRAIGIAQQPRHLFEEGASPLASARTAQAPSGASGAPAPGAPERRRSTLVRVMRSGSVPTVSRAPASTSW